MNNEAQFGVRFAVKNAKQVQKTMDAINAKLKQMGVSTEQVGKKIDQTGKEAESTGKKQDKTLDSGVKKADKMTNALDRVMRKWLSIGGAITLVSMVIRKALSRVDELTGLNRMAQSAGVAQSKIYSLGKELKKLYGADASSAASAYTSLGDILGGARSGRGISSDVVTAASRYGIALNGGMLTEDQLMTNIAVAMKAQRNKGNMYGVRDIANAFGIDEAMMLHLSNKGKDWDRGLPAANLKEAQDSAKKARELQDKLDTLAKELIDNVLPLVVKGMQAIVDVVDWLKQKYGNFGKEAKAYNSLAHPIVNGKEVNAYKVFGKSGVYNVNDNTIYADSLEQAIAKEQNKYKKDPFFQMSDNARLAVAQDYAAQYNKTMDSGTLKSFGLPKIQEMISGISAVNANLATNNGKVSIVIEDKAGALRNMNVTGKINGSNTINVATSVK